MLARFGSTLRELSLHATDQVVGHEMAALHKILTPCTSVRHLRLEFPYWKSLTDSNIPTDIHMCDRLVTLEVENGLRVGYLALQLVFCMQKTTSYLQLRRYFRLLKTSSNSTSFWPTQLAWNRFSSPAHLHRTGSTES